jgi:hypothetical protein
VEKLIEQLTNYYQSKGISAIDFHCPHYRSCSQTSPKTFTTAKEAFVSSGYVKHDLPRIVFISLDSGSAENDPRLKTLESIRVWEEEQENVLALPRNKHWYRTHELAHTILSNFKPDLQIDESRHYFAHVNSAKCCMNNPQRAQANQILFDNCREFIPGELEILDPDIIITQGKWARLALDRAFPEITASDIIPETIPEMKVILINDHPVIWIETFHPRHTSFHTVNRANYSQYVDAIKRFFNLNNDKDFQIIEEQQSKSLPEKTSIKPKPTEYEKEITMPTRIDKNKENYIALDKYPDYPSDKTPSKADCKGYTYMSMVQLCNISESLGKSRGFACNAFGGDKGKYKVSQERKARKWYGEVKVGIPVKFVLISAVEEFFREEGLNWK